MKRKVYLVITIALLCISIQGCGKVENNTGNNESSYISSTSGDETSSSNSSNNLETTSSGTTASPNNNTETPSNEQNPAQQSPDAEPAPSVETHTEKLLSGQDYSDAYRLVKVLGLKEYKKLKSDNYTDKAKKGKKFLVLFLSVRNDSSEDDYINYNYISAKVDGKKIEHTFLVNEPKGYPTIFTHVPAGKGIGGFIVWEVPSGWEKLEFTYNGWEDINNVSLESEFTPNDLSDPVIYNANDFN